MRRNSGKRYPKNGYYYNVGGLNEAREQAELTVRGIAVRLGLNQDTAIRVFNGTASQKQVWPYALYLNIDWSKLHDLNLPPSEFRFHRAGLNGSSRAVR